MVVQHGPHPADTLFPAASPQKRVLRPAALSQQNAQDACPRTVHVVVKHQALSRGGAPQVRGQQPSSLAGPHQRRLHKDKVPWTNTDRREHSECCRSQKNAYPKNWEVKHSHWIHTGLQCILEKWKCPLHILHLSVIFCFIVFSFFFNFFVILLTVNCKLLIYVFRVNKLERKTPNINKKSLLFCSFLARSKRLIDFTADQVSVMVLSGLEAGLYTSVQDVCVLTHPPLWCGLL